MLACLLSPRHAMLCILCGSLVAAAAASTRLWPGGDAPFIAPFWLPGSLAALTCALGWLALQIAMRRHKAELAAANAGSEYRLLADHATDLIVRARADGKRLYVSPACETLFGYTQAEMQAETTGQLTHPEDWEREKERFAASFGTPGGGTFTMRMRRKDGSYVWVEANTKALPRQPGRPAENVLVMRDISERQAAASRLEEANRRLQRAEAIAHVGHWHVAVPSRAVFWSDEVFRIHGLPIGAMPTIAASLACYHPEERERLVATLQRAEDTGAPIHMLSRIVRADGTVRHVMIRGEAEHDEDGRMVGLVGTFQDVTESHELEAQLRHHQRLETIGRMAAGVAHDFNNVLQGVLGSLELIVEDASAGSDVRACAEIALNSATRGASLTNQLLSFARKQFLLPQAVAVAPLLDEMRELCTRTLGKHIEITVATQHGMPSLFVDPQHLKAALLNLAVNAAHAMPTGGRLRMEATLEGSMSDEGWVVFAVSDTGAGMDAHTLSRATEPFFTTKGMAGTGLGLPMVQGFARQSGGDMRLSSTPGAGTKVELLLPGYAVAPAAERAEAAPRGSGRVLVVDDVSDVLDSAKRFLARAGFSVTTAADGDAALALLASGERFDALVTDYAMPGLSGVDLVLLAREMQPALPAIIMTGFAEVDTSRIAAVAAPLRKPFLRKQLIAAIDGVMAARLEPAQAP